MYYSILIRWGPEWDGQRVSYTKSKALFELMRDTRENKYFSDFSLELQTELKEKWVAFDWESPYPADGELEDIDILQAIEWLEESSPKFPITLLDSTEFTPTWNW
jgi:hypothetical protein